MGRFVWRERSFVRPASRAGLPGLLVVAAVGALLVAGPWGGRSAAQEVGAGKPTVAQPAVVRLSNEFIQVVVNASSDASGRFSVSTTGGNPDRAADDGRPLIYGGEEPWTSFSTVRIDGTSYVFGGPTNLPAGGGGPFGTQVSAPVLREGAIETEWGYPGGIEVLQRLTIARGRTTGLLDTVRVEYVIENRGDDPHEVGLRVVLDTMAGSNDGAPFRVGEQAVETDTALQAGSGAQMPEFFQVFDSLAHPSVVAQATLRGGEVTVPDRVHFTNWGVLRESLWDFDFQVGRSFERKGEYELDSAVALFFEPKTVAPGATRSVVAYYGLGGISIAPGVLAVGLSGPEMAVVGQSDPISIVAYVQNTGRGAARQTSVRLQLPDGMELVPGEQIERHFAEVDSGKTVQAMWTVAVTARSPGQLTYSVQAEAANAEPNIARRTLRVVTPAKLRVQLRGPARLGVRDGLWDPFPFEVTGVVRNEGGVDAHSVSAQLVTIYGLRVAPGDSDRRYVGVLGPGEQIEMRWYVEPTGVSGNIYYSLKVTHAQADEQPVPTNTVMVPKLEPAVFVAPGAGWIEGGVPAGLAFNVEVLARNLPPFATAAVEIAFDPAVLRLASGSRLSVDRGTLFVQGGRAGQGASASGPPVFTVESADDEAGKVTVRGASPAMPAWGHPASLLVLRFVGHGPGQCVVKVRAIELRDASGQVVYSLGPDGSLPGLSVAVKAGDG